MTDWVEVVFLNSIVKPPLTSSDTGDWSTRSGGPIPSWGAQTRSLPTGRAAWFTTTHWSVVLTAGSKGDSPEAAEALEDLCKTYWFPLYAFVRRRGVDQHEAQDLTQAFFVRLLKTGLVSRADREKGKFRSFLLCAFKDFLSDAHARAVAAKRGGGRPLLSLDYAGAEENYLQQPSRELAPDKIFERQWAVALLEQALARLRKEFEAESKLHLFEGMKEFLNGDVETRKYGPLALKLGMSTGALAVAVHRLRQRYRQLVRAEIANTVSAASEIEEEMRCLLAALGG